MQSTRAEHIGAKARHLATLVAATCAICVAAILLSLTFAASAKADEASLVAHVSEKVATTTLASDAARDGQKKLTGDTSSHDEDASNASTEVPTIDENNGEAAASTLSDHSEPVQEQKKVALPAITKQVSAGGAWSRETQAQAGSILLYRITATLPEDVENWSELVYRIIDNPAPEITVDWTSLKAHLESSSGTNKALLPATTSPVGSSTAINLGDLKKADPNISFGDTVVIEYAATLPTSASTEIYRNVARLEYLIDNAWEPTVDVDTTTRISNNPAAGSPASGNGSTFAKTGYYLMRYWWVAALVGAALVTVGLVLKKAQKKNASKD